jgi:hypothetical protein
MRAKLTPAFVEKAAPPETGVEVVYWDTGLAGFGLAVTRAGHKSYVVGYRANGRKRRMHLKRGLTFTDARKQAIVGNGGDPLDDRRKVERAKADTFKAIWEEWAEKAGGGLRSLKERRRVFGKQIGPVLGALPIEEITRSDIVRLLDRIVAENGPVVADSALAYIRRVMNWHQARSETYRSPIVRGADGGCPMHYVQSAISWSCNRAQCDTGWYAGTVQPARRHQGA